MSDNTEKKEMFLARMAFHLLKPYRYDENKAWEKVYRNMGKKSDLFLKFRWLKYVAVFAGGIGISVLAYLMLQKQETEQLNVVSSICVVKQQPELILASGQRVVLDDSLQGKNLRHDGMLVHVDSTDRRLKYENTEIDQKMIGFNTLKVPKGGEYSLVLPDGSVVWLNAESSIRFPVAFKGGKREVFLEGEAFFKVAPDKNAPFHVYASGHDVCVLGTSFNVCAYADDSYFRSTLVTGKVSVADGQREIVLQPSEQYSENQRTGEIEVKEVDTELYTSWLQGKIRFKGERLEDIVNKLRRWFDFEIFYANETVKDMKFRGVINKYDSFETVLKNLEQTTDIRFHIQGSTVIARKIYND